MSLQAIRIVEPNEAKLLLDSNESLPLQRKLRILLVKPHQKVPGPIQSPPLGLLYIASGIREKLGEYAEIRVVNMKLHAMKPERITAMLDEFSPDVVGFSSLNYEAHVTHYLARLVKEYDANIITVLGGPYALKNAPTIMEDVNFDWVFEGAADRTFPDALCRMARNQSQTEDMLGMSFRREDGSVFHAAKQDQISDLDALPPPAWDLVDLDVYAKKPNMMANLKGKRYALLFTSRGCPYLCNYCHDIFSKKFVYHSTDYVIAEIERLYEQYGVDEFHIVDDIFNLHKPRLKAIMATIKERWPGKIKIGFPNGLRGDILDEEVVNALCDAGTYAVCVAIETVTPRLQTLIDKHLDIEKTRNAIRMFAKRDIQITGFFMLGFPSETPEEIQATLDFVFDSELTLAFIFSVVPQFGTPIYDIALAENKEVTEGLNQHASGSYRSSLPWYQQVTGYPLATKIRIANVRFYFTPRRIVKILRYWSFSSLLIAFVAYVRILLS